MREPQDKVINGRNYRITPLGASKGLGILTLLTKHIARGLESVPSLAALAEHAGTALADVASNLDEAHVDRLCKTLAESAQVEPTPGSENLVPLASCYENHFAGNYGELVAFVAFALEVNFGSFLDLIKTTMATRAPAPAASAAAGK